jgi:hypothetical protein
MAELSVSHSGVSYGSRALVLWVLEPRVRVLQRIELSAMDFGALVASDAGPGDADDGLGYCIWTLEVASTVPPLLR